MTTAQHGRYWREWGKVRKLLTTLGEFSAADADAERMEIHKRALGVAKSSKDLTNRDLDKIFPAFAKYLVIYNGPSKEKAEDQPRKRLVWAINKIAEKAAWDPSYLQTIAQDQFKRTDWQNLPMQDLEKFRFTANARYTAQKRAAKQQQP